MKPCFRKETKMKKRMTEQSVFFNSSSKVTEAFSEGKEEEQVKISEIFDLNSPNLSIETIKERNYSLGYHGYLGLIEETFSKTTLAKDSFNAQLQGYLNSFNNSSMNDASKSWLSNQLKELMKLETTTFFEHASKGIKRVYLHRENKTSLQFIFLGVAGIKAGKEFSTEHASFEFIQFRAVLRKDFLKYHICF